MLARSNLSCNCVEFIANVKQSYAQPSLELMLHPVYTNARRKLMVFVIESESGGTRATCDNHAHAKDNQEKEELAQLIETIHIFLGR